MAPLRNTIAGGAGGAIGAGLVAGIGGFVVLGGPVGWIVGIAGVAGFLYGAAGALANTRISEAEASEAFQSGLLSGLRVGSEVLRITSRHRDHLSTVSDSLSSERPVYASLSSTNSFQEEALELTNDRGQRIRWETANCDLDLSTQSRFRMATGVAARCDACGKVLSIGSDWYHAIASEEDLCARHLSEVPQPKCSTFRRVDREEALGANRNKYALKIRVPADVFPRPGPHVEGKVVLEVSHLINKSNTVGNETLASLVRPLLPCVTIEECEGPRNFCRIIVDMMNEAAVREVIKSLGKQRNKRVSIKEISREFNSPRF